MTLTGVPPGTATKTKTAMSTADVTSTAPVLGGGGNTVFWTEGNTPTVIDLRLEPLLLEFAGRDSYP